MSSKKINKLKITEKIRDENNVDNIKFFQINEKLNNIINKIKSLIFNNIDDSITKTINACFHEINEIFENLLKSLNSMIYSKKQNEIIQRKDEQNIRNLYGKLFHEKLLNEIHENKIYFLTQKEKEYELLKQKTGAIICNGKIICNERKDNEIIILRTENSLLKSAIKNNEDLIKEKNDLINTLNKDILFYKAQIDELRQTKTHEFSSFSNINININEPKNNYNNKKKNSPKHNNANLYTNTIEISSSNKKVIKNKNINSNNNIYSSYQINSQLINKLNNGNNNKNKKEEYLHNKNNTYRDMNKNNTIDSNVYYCKYISVNKSLFSPINELKIKDNSDNNKQAKQYKKKNYFKNNIPLPEYNTISNEFPKRKEIKLKKNAISNQTSINHRKANSIQIVDNSIKKINIIKKEKSFSNEKNNIKNKNLQSVLKKINDIKNLKKNYESESITAGNLIKNKVKNNKNQLNNNMFPYIEKKKNNKGRNEKNDNSFNFMSKTTYNYYPNWKKKFNI